MWQLPIFRPQIERIYEHCVQYGFRLKISGSNRVQAGELGLVLYRIAYKAALGLLYSSSLESFFQMGIPSESSHLNKTFASYQFGFCQKAFVGLPDFRDRPHFNDPQVRTVLFQNFWLKPPISYVAFWLYFRYIRVNLGRFCGY